MPAIELSRRPAERIWGRTDLPPPFDALAGDGRRIGEIWFEAPGEPDLLVKYLFTSEALSVQVHPDAAEARRRGLRSGKDEAWLILEAEPGAAIGLGLTGTVSSEDLRAAALSGEIEHLLDWRPVSVGEIIPAPAGTIHAIGAGLSLIEIQQNCDVTYRLYDYGRDRPLQIEEALSVARADRWCPPPPPRTEGEGREIAVAGAHLVIERWTGERTVRIDVKPDRAVFLIAVADSGTIDGRPLRVGTVWMVASDCELNLAATSTLLVAYAGPEVRGDFWTTSC